MELTPEQVLKQSKEAFGQWEETWKENSALNGKLLKKIGTSQKDILGSGAGRNLLIVAMGSSLERNIDLIKKNRDKFDVMCVDKAFGKLIDHGIIPQYVVLADAKDVNGNPEWTHNWLSKVYFYVNKDNIKSEEIFCKISGCKEVIPAGSNVGNTCVIFAGQVLKYDVNMLIGYDYCWYEDESYYAFEDCDKRYWMKHHYLIDGIGRLCMTSGNLLFSCKWLTDFLTGVVSRMNFTVVNCSGGLLRYKNMPLKKVIDKLKNRKVGEEERKAILDARTREIVVNDPAALDRVIKEKNVVSCAVRYLEVV
jgi:hypothetical protein